MKRDFNIGIRSGILDQKHMDVLGKSPLWLYLWLIDRQGKRTDKVSGGKPIVATDFIEDFPEVDERTYRRWLKLLVENGYISTTRTPHGYVIAIEKSKKWHKSDRTEMSDQPKKRPDTVVRSDRTEMSDHPDRNVRSNIRATISNNKATIINARETDDLLTNKIKPTPKSQTNPQITDLIDFFEHKFDKKLKDVWRQQQAASNLIQHYGFDAAREGVEAAYAARDERYAPSITSLNDLWEKWDKLESFYRRNQRQRPITAEI